MPNNGEHMSLIDWITEVFGISAPSAMEIVFICSIPILIFGLTILCIVLAIMKKSRGFALVGLSGIMTICLAGFSASGANFDPSILCGLFVLTALAGIVLVIVEYVGKLNDSNVIMMQQAPIQHVVVTEVQPQAANNEGQSKQDEISEIKSTIDALNERLDTISSESEDS